MKAKVMRVSMCKPNKKKVEELIALIDQEISACYSDLSEAENNLASSIVAGYIRSRFSDIRTKLQSIRLNARDLKKLCLPRVETPSNILQEWRNLSNQEVKDIGRKLTNYCTQRLHLDPQAAQKFGQLATEVLIDEDSK